MATWHLLRWGSAVLSHRFVLQLQHGSAARASPSVPGVSAVIPSTEQLPSWRVERAESP
jgi:hypothetical protein